MWGKAKRTRDGDRDEATKIQKCCSKSRPDRNPGDTQIKKSLH